MTAPQAVLDLTERFERNLDAYRSGHYKETPLRRDFIDPFFKALGWDIDNDQGHAEAYRDVFHEDSIKVGGTTKAPDYCFTLSGRRKFFLEAKKPSIDIKGDPNPAYQLRRYAWSAKLPLSILTDFEELAVYDCRIEPVKTDKPSTARVLYLTYTEYADRWEELYGLFSKDAVLKGDFDRFVASATRKRGTAEVDDAFLSEIETWRDELARNIALRNLDLSQREVNFAVGRTIDRIIFLRICEDRGIEEPNRLMALQNGTNIYRRLIDLYHRADEKYNSGLFHFRKERDRPLPPDELTLKINIDDKVLKDIFKDLYYPDSPYEFSVLPADILGQVYEQFLGKVIRLTPGHQAKVEDKPEVKKAGGVYYTPTYIVDYIVKHTVGKLLEDKTPRQAAKLRILDPACGSGSFLLGAYQLLLDWHRDWYVEELSRRGTAHRAPNDSQIGRVGATHRVAHTKEFPIYQAGENEYRLTTAERKRILLNNIYGVDIDPQAVEVTKLSLLLKVLEGESGETINRQLKLLHERALPDLGSNIKCGNSLIGPDFYEGRQLDLLDEEERYRINVFDWEAEFSEIFNRQGAKKEVGFDAVIGNPPYIPIEEIPENQRTYFQARHPQIERKYDSSVVFVLALLDKLRSTGLLGFISSITWQTGENYALFRKYLFNHSGVVQLINLPFDVFKAAYVDTGIYVFSRKARKEYLLYRFPKREKVNELNSIEYLSVPTELIKPPSYKIVFEPRAQSIINRSLDKEEFVEFGYFSISTQGLAGGRFTESEKKLNDEYYPFLREGQSYRYLFSPKKSTFVFMGDKATLKRYYKEGPKILIRRIVNRQDRIMCTYYDQQMVFKKDINPFIITDENIDPFFVLGVLNSRLLSYLYTNTSAIATKDDFRQTTLAELRRLPIPRMYRNDQASKKVVKSVKNMLALHKQLAAAHTEHDKTALQRQIDATDKQIDKLVYELYGLTKDEIGIVEGMKE